jgi:spermidine/putrescine transport system substrate-binding protein
MISRTANTALAALVAGLGLATVEAKAQEISGTLNVLSWGDYIDFAIEEFEQRHGVTVNIDYYGSETEAINKIRAAGLGTYDVVFLGVGYDAVANEQGLLSELDVQRLTNFGDLWEPWQRGSADGKHYCATYAWGANGLFAYNTDLIDAELTSWEDVFSGEYKGRIGRIDKANEQVWRNGVMIGHHIQRLTDEELAEVEATTIENLRQARTVYSHYDEMAQLMASEEIWIADTDDGGYRQAVERGVPLKLVYPAEGFHGWYDGPCIVADAPNEDAAYVFIDYMLSPEVHAGVARELGYAPSNSRVVEILSAEEQAAVGIDQAEDNIAKLDILQNFGAEFDQKVSRLWQRAKNEALR